MTLKERLQKLKERSQNDIKNKDVGPNIGRKPINTSNYPNISFFDPKTGVKIKDGVYTCNIDIIPWIVQSDSYPSQEIKRGWPAYKLLILVHRGVGPTNDSIICPRTIGKNCPICEEQNLLREQGREKEAEKLIPSWRVCYNVIDLNDPERGIQLFIASRKNFDLAMMSDADIAGRKVGKKIDLLSYHIEFRATTETWNKVKFFKYSNFEFEEQEEEISEDLVNNAYPLEEMAVYLSYKEINDIFLHKEEKKEEEAPTGMETSSSSRKEKEKPPWEEDEKSEKSDEPGPDDFEKMSLPTLRKYIRENLPEKKIDRKMTREDLIVLITGGHKTNEEAPDKMICPFKHKFGEDADNFDDCAQCDAWNECVDAYEKHK